MTLTLRPVAFGDLQGLRAAYLASLSEPQEFHCERLSRGARPFLLVEDGRTRGYGLTDGATTLVECHGATPTLFDHLVEQAGLRRALCKSFDGQLHSACTGRAAKATTKGLLYRKVVDAGFAPEPTVHSRVALERDVPAVIAADDGFFRDDAEATAYARAGQMFVYETEAGLAGCGLLQRVTPDREAYDIGMMVTPAQRRRGLGRHIVRHLVQLCLATGKRPIAGCSVENLASQRCLESAGFRSEHRLIEFVW